MPKCKLFAKTWVVFRVTSAFETTSIQSVPHHCDPLEHPEHGQVISPLGLLHAKVEVSKKDVR